MTLFVKNLPLLSTNLGTPTTYMKCWANLCMFTVSECVHQPWADEQNRRHCKADSQFPTSSKPESWNPFWAFRSAQRLSMTKNMLYLFIYLLVNCPTRQSLSLFIGCIDCTQITRKYSNIAMCSLVVLINGIFEYNKIFFQFSMQKVPQWHHLLQYRSMKTEN